MQGSSQSNDQFPNQITMIKSVSNCNLLFDLCSQAGKLLKSIKITDFHSLLSPRIGFEFLPKSEYAIFDFTRFLKILTLVNFD